MIEGLPLWVEILFLACCFATIIMFYFANGKPKMIVGILLVWSILHSLLAFIGFYQNSEAMPPRFALVLVPTTFIIVYSLFSKHRISILENRDLKISTFSHVVRLPVEIVLHQLFLFKAIPELMTFEGRNFDIIMGVTAPIVCYLLVKDRIGKRGLLIWNVVGLFLIFFILFNGLLSAELPFQQFAFDQPNVALNYFPFILLPAVVVPIVIWTHITDIIKLMKS